ncbi:MAG: AAA family ATPase [Erysipelotrichaceae bacterium]
MKTITFNRLKISNFKGIDQRSIQFNSINDLRGANGTGKTTVADALWWVLFGKDSSGATAFPVKRKDPDGEDIREIIVEIELSLLVDDVTHIFRRVQEENWVTKRGSITRVFEGNIQTLYYNDSKMKTEEYTKAVNAIVNENTFKMLTSPTYFMNQLDDKKRREELMKLVGNETDIEKSLLETPEFSMLRSEWMKDININKSFANIQEYIRQKARTNADEIDRLPYQIDELKRTITDEYDGNTIQTLLRGYQRDLENLVEPRPNEKPESVAIAEENMRQTKIVLDAMKDIAYNQFIAKRRETSVARQDVSSMIASLGAKKTMLANDLEFNRVKSSSKSREKDDLLRQYNDSKYQVFVEPTVNTTCPTCHRPLQDINPEEVIDRARIQFENDRKAKVDGILVQGNALKNEIEKLANDAADLEEKRLKIDEEIAELNVKLNGLPTTESILESDFIDADKQKELLERIEQAEWTVNQWRNGSSDDGVKLEYKLKRDELTAKINENNFRLGKLEAQKDTLKRIKELQGREESLLKLRDYFKTVGFQTEQFMKSKNEALEEALSSHFGQIKWKLFKQQVNGGFQQVCDPHLNGKPYDAQSTGERIYTGLDIIKCFQGEYQVSCPVIIDNRESLTLEIPMFTQIISMYADDQYSELKQF